MKPSIIACFLIAIATFSCRQDNLAANAPECIEAMIPVEDEAENIVSITRYRFEGEKVYYVVSECCDQFNNVYDKDCNVICAPDGGITGRGDGNCPAFFSDATKKKLIWELE